MASLKCSTSLQHLTKVKSPLWTGRMTASLKYASSKIAKKPNLNFKPKSSRTRIVTFKHVNRPQKTKIVIVRSTCLGLVMTLKIDGAKVIISELLICFNTQSKHILEVQLKWLIKFHEKLRFIINLFIVFQYF